MERVNNERIKNGDACETKEEGGRRRRRRKGLAQFTQRLHHCPTCWANGKAKAKEYTPLSNSFRYGEELYFSHAAPGKPVIAYSHKTWKLDCGLPMHCESGYWLPKPDGSIEVVIAQGTGLAEVLGTDSAEDKSSCSQCFQGEEDNEMVNGELHCLVQIATNLTTLQPHRKVVLKKLP
ncbi:UPF0678 fatty acid-binding protein-like protein At1g79260 [Hibiscus syriacus]|uniref:UPF0678 fatty acid-binding protein-like protein At1g79260 n=1 Tax=Hibiscus syriacus TaxID=106335 RepID=UPI0019243229|nr:UPF0678 fatty acid-binding protein-like protein At1g79260 [Hibiscus syriacus]